MIFIAADADHFVPYSLSLKQFELLEPKPFHHFEPIEGGNHWHSLNETVANFVAETFGNLESKILCLKLFE